MYVEREIYIIMIYSAFDPYRILHTCVYITEHDCLSTTVHYAYAPDSCSMDQDAHSLPHKDPYINYLTGGCPLLSISSVTHACNTRSQLHGLGLLAYMVLASIPSLH